MLLKLFKALIIWSVVTLLYISSKRVHLDFIFNFIAVTFFIPVISKIINNERYNQLSLKQECLRAVYDLTKYLNSTVPEGIKRPIADSYPGLDKAVENSGIFIDRNIATIMYDLYDAIRAKDHERISSINIEYLKDHLQRINQKTLLGHYLIHEVAIPIAIDLPSQLLKSKRVNFTSDD